MGTYNILIGGTNSISVGFSLQPVSIAVERSMFHIFFTYRDGKRYIGTSFNIFSTYSIISLVCLCNSVTT